MSKVKYKCLFQDIWLEDENYKQWLQKVQSNLSIARCKICVKDINIGTHGVTALNSHAKGSKHIERLPKSDRQSFFNKQQKHSESSSSSIDKDKNSLKQSTIGSCTNKNLVSNAEIIWALDVVLSKYSFNSSSNKTELFALMFPDSKVAKDFTCGKTKCSHLVNHGIAPYFHELLYSQLNSLDHFVAMFDESHNKIAKEGQMDLHIRFWDDTEDIVATRTTIQNFWEKQLPWTFIRNLKIV